MAIDLLRNLPSVSELLESRTLRELIDRVSHNVVVANAREVLDELRNTLRTAVNDAKLPDVNELVDRIAARVAKREQPSLRPVINATGILLHTGLGRAPLADEAVTAIEAVARDYASVEVDLNSGRRSQRVVAVEGLLRELTGAEAAVVVNNNAAATMLALAALASGREVIVSRGQLIEIGGSFRLPDVMRTSGAILREVGTTNKSRLTDYENAIGENTAALMRVHTSNFVVVGFTAEVPLEELIELGRNRGLPVIDDIGSGALVDFSQFGFTGEPIAAESIRRGADLVLFSGDKLLGGPQCGIAVGRKSVVTQLAKHPMMRALRVDKMTLATLAATLRLYRDPAQAKAKVPLLALLSTPEDNLRQRAERLAGTIGKINAVRSAQAVADVTFLGGGSIPTQKLPTWCVAIAPTVGLDALAADLRAGTPSVVGRVQEGRLRLDLRSVFPRQDDELVAALRTSLERMARPA